MENKIVYLRSKKLANEPISLTEAYKVYALNNGLPVYSNVTKEDGDYYIYRINGSLETSSMRLSVRRAVSATAASYPVRAAKGENWAARS